MKVTAAPLTLTIVTIKDKSWPSGDFLLWFVGFWIASLLVIWWAIAGWRRMKLVVKERERTIGRHTMDDVLRITANGRPFEDHQVTTDHDMGFFDKNYLRRQIIDLESNGVVSFQSNEEFEEYVAREWVKVGPEYRKLNAEIHEELVKK